MHFRVRLCIAFGFDFNPDPRDRGAVLILVNAIFVGWQTESWRTYIFCASRVALFRMSGDSFGCFPRPAEEHLAQTVNTDDQGFERTFFYAA